MNEDGRTGGTGSTSGPAAGEALAEAKRPAAAAAAPFDTKGYNIKDDAAEAALLSGAYAAELEIYFGEDDYRELQELARQSSMRRSRGGHRVLILPGIMGSKLGRKARLAIFDDVFWFDPVDVLFGKLRRLALDHGAREVSAVGVFLVAYLKLKLRLQIAGYDAEFYPYDWRQSIDGLGRELNDHIRDKAPASLSLVAHSMGGLVARSALRFADSANKVRRLVMLGTPNYGSFSPVQAIRGTHPTVNKIAKLARSTPAKMTKEIFSGFPGLYELLPSMARATAPNYFEAAAWPGGDLVPRPDVLRGASRVQEFLAKPTDKMLLIAGVNQPTIVAARVEGDEFVYEESNDGDGTVPLAFAQVEGIRTYYVEESHGSLPNNRSVARAVSDLLAGGSTQSLSDTPPAATRAAPRRLREVDLRGQEPFRGREGAEIQPSEARRMLEEFASPDARREPLVSVRAGAPSLVEYEAGFTKAYEGVVVGRRRQHRLDIQLAKASITDVEARAYVIGVYREVAPAGPADAIDDLMGGAITEFTRRRMFSGEMGEMFMLPAGRNLLRADLVLLAGLGQFDRYTSEVQELVAENVIRTFLRTRVEDFATVAMGGGSGLSVQRTLYHMLAGFVRGLIDADVTHQFRSVTICERDADRYEQIRTELFRLTSTPLCEDIQITLTELKVVPGPTVLVRERGPGGGEGATRPRDPVYLMVQTRPDEADGGGGRRAGRTSLHAAVLTAGASAQVIPRSKPLAAGEVAALLGQITPGKMKAADLQRIGEGLNDLLLTPEMSEELYASRGRHLVIVHDRESSRFPWETLRIRDWSPASAEGISHRFLTSGKSVATYSERHRRDGFLDVLLVADPTDDLPGAEAEVKRLQELFGRRSAVRITPVFKGDATKGRILKELRSGRFDVMHYAGHAFFDAERPGSSGLRCSGGEVLAGADLVGMPSLPSLIFLNACEIGRVRRSAGRDKPADRKLHPATIERTNSVAETLLRSGVANFLGTYWEVGDQSAKTFSETLYGELMEGQTLACAITAGRKRVLDGGSVDWADYIHYGSYDFILKEVTDGASIGSSRAAST